MHLEFCVYVLYIFRFTENKPKYPIAATLAWVSSWSWSDASTSASYTRQINRGWLKLTSKSYYPVLNLICLMWAHSFPRTEHFCLSLEIKWSEVDWKIKEASTDPAVSMLISAPYLHPPVAIHQNSNHLFVSKSVKWLLSHCWSLQCRPLKYRSCNSIIGQIIPMISLVWMVIIWRY